MQVQEELEKTDTTCEMTESIKTYQIQRFNGQHYQLWRRQMEIFMTDNKLKPYIVGTIESAGHPSE